MRQASKYETETFFRQDFLAKIKALNIYPKFRKINNIEPMYRLRKTIHIMKASRTERLENEEKGILFDSIIT